MPIGERNLSPSFIQLRTPARINICSVTQQPPGMIVRYGGLLLALYNYNGLVAPGLSLYSGFIFTRFLLCSGCVPCSSSVHRAPG